MAGSERPCIPRDNGGGGGGEAVEARHYDTLKGPPDVHDKHKSSAGFLSEFVETILDEGCHAVAAVFGRVPGGHGMCDGLLR